MYCAHTANSIRINIWTARCIMMCIFGRSVCVKLRNAKIFESIVRPYGLTHIISSVQSPKALELRCKVPCSPVCLHWLTRWSCRERHDTMMSCSGCVSCKCDEKSGQPIIKSLYGRQEVEVRSRVRGRGGEHVTSFLPLDPRPFRGCVWEREKGAEGRGEAGETETDNGSWRWTGCWVCPHMLTCCWKGERKQKKRETTTRKKTKVKKKTLCYSDK